MRSLLVIALLAAAIASACGAAGAPPSASPAMQPGGGTEDPKTYPQPTKSGPGYGY